MGDGSFIVTHSGHKFYFEHPEEFVYLAGDIGYALGNLCRFAGQGGWYSVAQHSLFVASLVNKEDKLRALLHDASEAYLVDIPGPLKRLPIMSGYRELEARVMAAIHKQFGVPEDSVADERVKYADLVALKAEAKILGLYTDEWGVADMGFPDSPIPPFILGLSNGMISKVFEQEVSLWK